MDLSAIKFNVETGELARAISEIDKVATALGNMSSKVKEVTKVKQDSAKAEKEAIALSKEAAKLKEAEAKASKAVADAEAAEARAKVAKTKVSNDAAEASKKATKAQDDLVESLSGTDRILAKQALSMQILRGETITTADGIANLGAGFSKSQAGMLANLQLLGATGKEMQTLARSFEDYNRITGLNTFDKSASGISKLKKELTELNNVNGLTKEGMSLTRDELVNYMRDSERLVQQMKSEGHSTEWLAQEQAQLKQAYLTTSTELNRLRAESKRMEDQAKQQAKAEIQAANDRAKAQNFVAQEMNRVNAAYLAATGEDKMNISTSNRLLKMEEALRLSGDSAEVAARKLAFYKQQLQGLQKAGNDRAVDNISRALGPQITDITIGLATGQSLMTVLLQQGGQLRDQMALAGVAADQMGAAIRRAGAEMVSSVWATGKGVIGGLAGAFVDLGRSAGSSIAQSIVGLDKFYNRLVLSKEAYIEFEKGASSAFGRQQEFIRLVSNSTAIANAFAIGLGVMGSAIIAATVSFFKVDAILTTMNRNLVLTGASLGVSKDSALSLASSLETMGVSTMKGVAALSEMAAQGGTTIQQLNSISRSAENLGVVFGITIKEIVKQYADLNKDPVQALIKLQKETGLVNEAILEQVELLRRQGQGLKATEIASAEMAKVHRKAAMQALDDLSFWSKAVLGLKWTYDKLGDSILGLFAGKSAAERVKETSAEVERLTKAGYTLESYQLRDALKAQREAFAELKTEQDKAREQQKRSTIAGYKETALEIAKGANSALTQEAMKGMSFTDYLEKAWELKIPDAKAREWARNNGNTFELFSKATKLEYDKMLEKSKGPKGRTPTSPGLFDLSSLKSQTDNALSLIKGYADSQIAIYENAYKSGELSLGEFLSSEIAMIEYQGNAKAALLNAQLLELDARQKESLSSLEAWKSTLTETEDKKRAQKQIESTKDAYEKMRATAQAQLQGIADDTAKAIAKSMQELAKFAAESVKLYESFTKGIQERQAARQIELQDQQNLINLSGEQLAAEKARLAEVRATSDAILQQVNNAEKLKKAYDELQKARPMSAEAAEAFKAYQDAQARVAQMKQDTETAAGKAAVDAVALYQMQEYQKLKEGIADALTTALFEGGKAGSKKFRDLLVAELRKPITVVVNAVANIITGSISSLLGNGSGSTGTASSLMSTFSNATDAYNAFTGAYGAGAVSALGSAATSLGGITGSSALTNFGIGVKGGYLAPGLAGPTTVGAPGAMGAGATTGSALGAAATTVAGIYGGVTVGKMISGGYSAFGSGSGNSAVNTGTATGAAIGSIIPGIGTAIGALIGGALGGLTNRLFGKKLDKLGIEGTFSGSSFSGNRYEYYKGGLFSSSETKRKPLDQETKDALGQSFAAIKNQFVSLADWFGTSTEADVVAYTKKIKLNLKGKSQKQIDEIFKNLFSSISEDMAKLVLKGTNFSKTGETAVQTLERLKDSLVGVNQVMDTLGMSLLDISLLSGDMASALVDVFGGMDKFQTATASYYEKFYSEEEKLATATRQLTTTFAAMGLTLPATREAFKDLVSAQDLTTASGQLTFAALIGLSDVFYEITNPLEEATQKMQEFTNSILEYINSLSMTEGNASQNYGYAQAMFSQQLLLAKAGDQTAMDNITSYSDKLIELAKQQASSPLEFETILGSIKAELLGLVTGVPAGSVLSGGLTPNVLSGAPVANTATQIVEQTATTQQLLTSILTKLTEMQAEDRAEGSQNVVNLNTVAKVFKRIDNGDSIKVTTVV